jgi:UDPglucose 6-dehydrogenase
VVLFNEYYFMKNPSIGFIGQGFIGKNYADDFENRGYKVTRYSLDEKHCDNKDLISECDIVFIAVPTPTTPNGFSFEILRESLRLIGKGKIAVIKSTLLPGTTKILQEENPAIFVFHSPEFLREVSAAYDAANPERNIVGIPNDNEEYKRKATEVIAVLPNAPFSSVCSSEEAEIIKYAGNNFLTTKVVYMNIIYDVSEKFGCNWSVIRDALVADSRIGSSHMNPVHDGGRGAGGHCFIKDFAAFRMLCEKLLDEDLSTKVLQALEKKNVELLLESGKNNDLLQGVYGNDFLK